MFISSDDFVIPYHLGFKKINSLIFSFNLSPLSCHHVIIMADIENDKLIEKV